MFDNRETIFFGQVSLEDLEYTDPVGLFRDGNKFFWYKLVLEEDQAVLWDTCDRHFPVSYDHINALETVITFGCERFNIMNSHIHQAHWEIDNLRQETQENLKLLA